MTGMGMTQLPTPDFTAGRQESSSADHRSDRKREDGSRDGSRFDDVARQQQKRLDAKADARRPDSVEPRRASDERAPRSEQESASKPQSITGEADAVDAGDHSDNRVPLPDFAAMSFDMPTEPVAQPSQVLPPLPPPPPPTGPQLTGAGLPGQLASLFPGQALVPGEGVDGELASRELFNSLQQTVAGRGQLADGTFPELLKAPAVDRMASNAELTVLSPASQPGIRGMETPLMRGYATSVEVPVGAADWGEKVMGKLTWLTAAQMTVAEIHVTPPELGPLDVRVQVQNDQATVTVHASTPAVRDQLEAQSQRLRDMLAEQGLHLQGFDVTDSGTRERSGESPDQFAGNGSGEGLGAVDDEMNSEAQLDLSWQGEVDLYV